MREVEKGHLVGCVQVFSSTEGRVHIEKQKDTSSFVIESTERADEGRYTIKVTNPVGEDVATIFLRVVGEQRGARGLSQGGFPEAMRCPLTILPPLPQMSQIPRRLCVSHRLEKTGPP